MKEKIIAYIEEMETVDLIQLHNEYCMEVNTSDNYIFSMDDLDMICQGQDAYWIACRTYFGEFNANDDYIMFDGYGNFRTLNEYNAKHYIYIDEIADYIISNNNSLCDDEILDILEEQYA